MRICFVFRSCLRIPTEESDGAFIARILRGKKKNLLVSNSVHFTWAAVGILVLRITCLFFHPIYYVRPSFLSLLRVVTQIRGHIAGSSPPTPLRPRALHFFPEKILALSSFVNCRQIVPLVPRYALSAVHPLIN